MKAPKIKKFQSLYLFGLCIVATGAFLVIMFIGFITTIIVEKFKESQKKEIVIEKPTIKKVIIYDTVRVKVNDIIKEKPKSKLPIIKADNTEKDSL